MAADAPLTYGQLSTWRSVETFAEDRLMEVNVPALWDVSGMTEAEIHRGLRVLTARHEALRTTFHTDAAGAPFQRVHDDAPFAVRRVELPYTDPQSATRVLREVYATAFPVVGDTGRHAALLLADGRPAWLAVSMSHMVVDVWAIRVLEAQLRLAAAGSELPAPVPRELALLQRSDAWASRRRGAEKHWRKVLDSGPLANLPSRAAGSPSPERRVQATLRSHGLAVLLAEGARVHRVSPQSLLTALTGAALAALLDRDAVTLSLMCANRFDPAWLPLVSTMNQLVPLPCRVDRDADLAGFVKRTHLHALLAYRHGCYDVDAAARLAADAPGPGGVLFAHDCWFNYVTSPEPAAGPPAGQDAGDPRAAAGPGPNPGSARGVDGPSLSAAPPLPTGPAPRVPDASLVWSPPPRNAGHPFYLRVNGDGARWVELTLRVDPVLVSAEAVPVLLRTIAAGATRLLHAPDSRLGALAGAAVRDPLPADVFPPDAQPCPPAPDEVRELVQLPR